MLLGATTHTQVVIGYAFIIAGFVLIILATPALLKKAYGAQAEALGWGDVIGKLFDAGPAGIVAGLGVILILIGLVLIGVKIPSI